MINYLQAMRSKHAAEGLCTADLTPHALAGYYRGNVQTFLTDLIVFLQEFRNEYSHQVQPPKVPPITFSSLESLPIQRTWAV